MKWHARIAYALLTGYILSYFSEWMFWSGRPTNGNFLLDAIPTWFVYSFVAFLILAATHYFRAQSLPALFLIGALYGWLIEGVLVQTMYDTFPLNISFTALAWHAPLAVVFGIYGLPRILSQSSRVWRMVIVCVACGLFYGAWSIGWWLEEGMAIASPESIWVYNFAFGVPLMPVYALRSRLETRAFAPSRLEVGAVIALIIIYFGLVTLSAQLLSLFVLPPLLLILYWALRRNRQHTTMIQPESVPMKLRLEAMVLLIPLTASLIYMLAWALEWRIPTFQVFFVVAMPLGFMGLAWSVFKIFRSCAIHNDLSITIGAGNSRL